MELATRRRVLQTIGAGATGTVAATAGCSTLDDLSGGSGGMPDFASVVPHPGWATETPDSALDSDVGMIALEHWDYEQLRSIDGELPDWLRVGSNTMFELDALLSDVVTAVLNVPTISTIVTFTEAGAGVEAAASSEQFEEVPEVTGYHGRTTDSGAVIVVGEGVGMLLDADGSSYGAGNTETSSPDGATTESQINDMTRVARMLSNRPSSYAGGTESMNELQTLLGTVGSSTIASYRLEVDGTDRIAAYGDGFTVGADRTSLRTVGLGEDLDATGFKEYALQGSGRDYGAYENLEAKTVDGNPVLTGSVATEDFDKLSRD